ncbi:hypothetical protein MPTK1_6g01990 [Marchantia polymorpha subsp. ruderalis]|uniref:Uncharacterized protein n=2 Tax=Marchantia polymorpha TaxID=3197 RepID=A0AAF6BML2_MARPO|nr:hypothetical protein MARPO_0052s0006 [Marchantia polymorpha]BBN13246.1 hypothetical protein Mp_6g01990 [Marchantia polymorpha subsp. ruderalis]|eukprot:PTQ38200.1 hypothetical protein MARPO_0052s0006 [Marchantia polymorpha]
MGRAPSIRECEFGEETEIAFSPGMESRRPRSSARKSLRITFMRIVSFFFGCSFGAESCSSSTSHYSKNHAAVGGFHARDEQEEPA